MRNSRRSGPQAAERIVSVRVRDSGDRLHHAIAIKVGREHDGHIGDPFARIRYPVVVDVDEDGVADHSGAAVAEIPRLIAGHGVGQRGERLIVQRPVRIEVLCQAGRHGRDVHRHRVRDAGRGRPQAVEFILSVGVRGRRDRLVRTVTVEVAGQCHRDVSDPFAGIRHAVVIHIQ
jgi:hypothetical protein